MVNLLTIIHMNYNQAIELLYNSLPVFQNIGPGAYKPGLDTSRLLDDMAGNPHTHYPTVHIAGTNGKGSTAHSLAAILQEAGYRVVLAADGGDIKKMLKTKSAELAASLSTENMKLSPCDIYMIDICHNGTAITAALSSQRTGQFPFSRILRRGIWTDSPQALRR